MRYAGLKYNDIVDCFSGICVSYWCQGCPIRCPGCHNKETWDKDGGIEIDKQELINNIIDSIAASGIQRDFSVLGGEPLAPYNRQNTFDIIKAVKEKYQNIKIYLWTGYTYETIQKQEWFNDILNYIDYLIAGPYLEQYKDITLPLRGSTNQKIITVKDNDRINLSQKT